MTDHFAVYPVVLQSATARLLSLSTIDILIIGIYFFLVLAIGFYLKRLPAPPSTSSWPAGR